LEVYNLDRPDNKIINSNFPKEINVFKLPELFAFISMVFCKLKDEKDVIVDKMRGRNVNDSNST
jgi:hypothetical protein